MQFLMDMLIFPRVPEVVLRLGGYLQIFVAIFACVSSLTLCGTFGICLAYALLLVKVQFVVLSVYDMLGVCVCVCLRMRVHAYINCVCAYMPACMCVCSCIFYACVLAYLMTYCLKCLWDRNTGSVQCHVSLPFVALGVVTMETCRNVWQHSHSCFHDFQMLMFLINWMRNKVKKCYTNRPPIFFFFFFFFTLSILNSSSHDVFLSAVPKKEVTYLWAGSTAVLPIGNTQPRDGREIPVQVLFFPGSALHVAGGGQRASYGGVGERAQVSITHCPLTLVMLYKTFLSTHEGG